MIGGLRLNPTTDSIFGLTDVPVKNYPELMKEYTGWVKFESNIYQFQINKHLSPLKKLAIELLVVLKKEYHLK